MDLGAARRAFDQRLAMTLAVALYSRDKIRAGGTLLFIGGTGGRRPGVGQAIVSTVTVALPALTVSLALELAPTRANLIAPGLADASFGFAAGRELEAWRDELRATLPTGRVIGPADIAALAVHIMRNEALTVEPTILTAASSSFPANHSERTSRDGVHRGQGAARSMNGLPDYVGEIMAESYDSAKSDMVVVSSHTSR